MGFVHNKRKLEDGRWQVRKKVFGRPIERIVDTEDEADQLIISFRKKVAGQPAPKIRTMNQIINEYQRKLASEDAPGDTRDYYARVSLHLVQHLGPNAPPPSSQDEILGYVERRKALGGQGVSILKELSALRTYMRYSQVPITWSLPKMRVVHRETYCPSDEEIAKVYLSLHREDAQRAFLLALLAGMRTYEVLRAQWGDVDLDRRILTIHAAKTGATNHAHITDTLAGLLTGKGGVIVPLSKCALRDIMVRRTSGLPRPWSGVRYLRHVCATWALDSGFSETAVDGILSHARGGVTKRHYDHRRAVARAAESRPILEAVERRFVEAMTPMMSGVLRFEGRGNERVG